ncbi:MAG: flagellar biosynthesis protein FlhB [Armatimonadota bacterium]|nr:flagellar biosynthesis protein FlhB [bacterium]
MPLEDRTEDATPRRKHEAREEGRVARSVELNSALILLSALIILRSTGPKVIDSLRGLAIDSFTKFPSHDLTIYDVRYGLVQLLLRIGPAIAPLFFGVAVIGFVANVVQVGFTISGKALQFKGERLNPLSGITRMFSAQAGVELLKSVAKIAIVGGMVYSFIRDKYADIATLAGASYFTACVQISGLVWQILLRTAIVLFVIAALDYMFQRQQLNKSLKMTKQEVKEDLKRSEGDPHIKGKIRQKQRQMAQRRMMREVPKADVVVTNPTHFAVALKYDAQKSTAPIVVAKGKDFIAKRIKEIAMESNVPLVENVQLARALYAAVEIGDEIPANLYQAVAEVLAYVYRLSQKFKKL